MQPNRSDLAGALTRAMYGDPTNDAEVTARKLALKNYLEHLKTLVDEGRLGCIIAVELLSLDGTKVNMQPIGDARLILQAATQLVRQGLKQAAPEPDASEPNPSEH